MVLYLEIGKEKQQELIRKIKENCSYSWTQIAEELGVNRSMVLMYASGRCRIPRDKLEKLASLSSHKLDISLPLFKEGNYSLKRPRIPEMNEELAEFLGILYGDGCLENRGYKINISGDSAADLLYHKMRVTFLFEKLFELTPQYKFDKSCQEMHTYLYSKIVHSFLAENFSFPVGKKKGRMRIPKQIYGRGKYMKAFLRGLFDTDGGIHKHHEKSAQVHFTSADNVFLKEIYNLYKILGFNVRKTKEDLEFFSREEITKFFNELQPKNPKHMYKYHQFLETGKVPRHKDIDYGWLNSEYAEAGN